MASEMNNLSGSIVQIYYSRRVYIISRSRDLLILICFLTLVHAVLLSLAIFMGIFHPDKDSLYYNIVTTSFVATTITDILIASSLTYYLQIRKTGLTRTYSLVNSIILHVVGCGVLSSALSIMTLITYLAMNGSFVSFAVCSVLGKAYANSMLSSLNARASLRLDETHISLNAVVSVDPS